MEGSRVALILIALLIFAGLAAAFFSRNDSVPPGGDLGAEAPCIQVIATARNPATGETREFPTPCDIPDEWEIVSP